MFKKKLYLVFVIEDVVKELFATVRVLYYNKVTGKYHSKGEPSIIWDVDDFSNNTVVGIAFRNKNDALHFAEGAQWMKTQQRKRR